MKVELTYFKQNGTFYSSANYNTKEIDLENIWAEVRRMIRMEDLPNLTKDPSDFIVLIEVPKHQNNVKKLVGLNNVSGIHVGGNANGNFVQGNGNIIN